MSFFQDASTVVTACICLMAEELHLEDILNPAWDPDMKYALAMEVMDYYIPKQNDDSVIKQTDDARRLLSIFFRGQQVILKQIDDIMMLNDPQWRKAMRPILYSAGRVLQHIVVGVCNQGFTDICKGDKIATSSLSTLEKQAAQDEIDELTAMVLHRLEKMSDKVRNELGLPKAQAEKTSFLSRIFSHK